MPLHSFIATKHRNKLWLRLIWSGKHATQGTDNRQFAQRREIKTITSNCYEERVSERSGILFKWPTTLNWLHKCKFWAHVSRYLISLSIFFIIFNSWKLANLTGKYISTPFSIYWPLIPSSVKSNKGNLGEIQQLYFSMAEQARGAKKKIN